MTFGHAFDNHPEHFQRATAGNGTCDAKGTSQVLIPKSMAISNVDQSAEWQYSSQTLKLSVYSSHARAPRESGWIDDTAAGKRQDEVHTRTPLLLLGLRNP